MKLLVQQTVELLIKTVFCKIWSITQEWLQSTGNFNAIFEFLNLVQRAYIIFQEKCFNLA